MKKGTAHVSQARNHQKRTLAARCDHRSSVRLLESGSGTFTTELLGLASSGIGDEEGLVVLEEDFLELSLALFVMVLLVVGEEGLGDSLSMAKTWLEGPPPFTLTLMLTSLNLLPPTRKMGSKALSLRDSGSRRPRAFPLTLMEPVPLVHVATAVAVFFLPKV